MKKLSILFVATLFISTVNAQDAMFCTDSEVRALIEAEREAGVNDARSELFTNDRYQNVRLYSKEIANGGNEGGNDNDSEEKSCLANIIPAAQKKVEEIQKQVMAAYSAIKGIMAGGTMPFSFDWSTLLVMLESEMCAISDSLYETVVSAPQRLKNEARSRMAEQKNELPIAEYINMEAVDKYINNIENGEYQEEDLKWKQENPVIGDGATDPIDEKMESAIEGIFN
tara:strand:- start:943 stop:1623 length:681 start_codon:yes stop_codon:yes gene_type:complete